MSQFSIITKKTLILLTALGSVSVLAACGGGEPTADNTPTEETTEEQATTETDATTATAPTGDVEVVEPDTTATPVASETETIVAIASDNDSFSTLVAALEAAELTEVLSGEGPYTVFAPTDEAFAALPEGTVEELLKPENKDQLVQLLTYHVVPTKVLSTEITPGEVGTVEGQALNIAVGEDGQTVTVNDATVTQTDIVGSNGVIHVVDTVIIPVSEAE